VKKENNRCEKAEMEVLGGYEVIFPCKNVEKENLDNSISKYMET